jgi:hypothetical protein
MKPGSDSRVVGNPGAKSLRGGTPSMAIIIYYILPARLLPASTQRFIELNERQGFSLARVDQIQLIRE